MTGNSLQTLSQRLAERQASDLERIQLATSQALAKHEAVLSSLSSDAQRGMASDTEALRQSIRATTAAMDQARVELLTQTAAQIAGYTQALESEQEAARTRLRAVLGRSVVSLALVWGIALAGFLAALAGWFLAVNEWR